jgi:hypothetical protein
MPTFLLPPLLSLAAAALLINAVLLWLTCKWLGVRHPGADGVAASGVRFRRALTLAACSLTASVLAGVACWSLPLDVLLTLNAQLVASLALTAVILRVGLPVGWLRTAAVEALWTLVSAPFLVVLVLLTLDASFVGTTESAEAVRGWHKPVVCPQCSHAFVIDAPAGEDHDSCECPNCRANIPFAPAGRPVPPGGIANPDARPPERVVLARWLLGPETLPPERFDLVGVEWPRGEQDGRKLPDGRGLMRVAGLPGETIAIHHGDLYVRHLDGQSLDEDDPIPERRRLRWVFGGDKDGWRKPPKDNYCILRKPPAKVLALMHLVYDSRQPARDLNAPEDRRWVEDGGWWRAGTGFGHDGSNDAVAWLRYRHVLRNNLGSPALITDFSGYNAWKGVSHEPPGENWVADLILECDADPGPMGELTLELSRGPDRFQARFDLTARACTLHRVKGAGAEEKLAEARVKVPGKGARLRFANVDERLIVWVNDRLAFGDGVPYLAPKRLMPVKENDLDRPASVGARGTAVRVTRLRLFRDVYYEVGLEEHDLRRFPVLAGGCPDVPDFHPADVATWKHLLNAPAREYSIEEEQYFLLADNSPEWADSRAWGAYPRAQVAGRALIRYFPPARSGRLD